VEAPAAAALAGYLEAQDFTGDGGIVPPRRESLVGLSIEASDSQLTVLTALQAWRIRAGLRRAVDWGTRWVLFELQPPSICREVERAVVAFFQRMRCHGLLAAGPDASRVWCRRGRESFGVGVGAGEIHFPEVDLAEDAATETASGATPDGAAALEVNVHLQLSDWLERAWAARSMDSGGGVEHAALDGGRTLTRAELLSKPEEANP